MKPPCVQQHVIFYFKIKSHHSIPTYKLWLGRMLKFTFEPSLIKCSNIQSIRCLFSSYKFCSIYQHPSKVLRSFCRVHNSSTEWRDCICMYTYCMWIAHVVIKAQWCSLLIFLDYECTTRLQRILLQFKVCFTFKPSKHSKLRPSSNTYVGPLSLIYVMYYTDGCFGIMDFLKKDTCGHLSSWGTCSWQLNYLYGSLLLLNSFWGPSHSLCKSLYLTNYRINYHKPIDNIVFCCLGDSIILLLFT